MKARIAAVAALWFAAGASSSCEGPNAGPAWPGDGGNAEADGGGGEPARAAEAAGAESGGAADVAGGETAASADAGDGRYADGGGNGDSLETSPPDVADAAGERAPGPDALAPDRPTDDGGGDAGVPPCTAAPGYICASGARLYDSRGQETRITGISWFGLETPNFAPHGLWARSLASMLDQVRDLGFNVTPPRAASRRGLRRSGNYVAWGEAVDVLEAE